MHVTTIDRFSPEPGVFVRWDVDVTMAQPHRSIVPPSFNQSFHLDGVETSDDAPSVWLAASFDVDGEIDRVALGRAYRELVARHGTLHSGFHRVDGEIARQIFEPDELSFVPAGEIPTTTVAQTRELLRAALDAACHPLTFPSYLLGAISRPDRSTIVAGFDHSHVDAYSVSLVKIGRAHV